MNSPTLCEWGLIRNDREVVINLIACFDEDNKTKKKGFYFDIQLKNGKDFGLERYGGYFFNLFYKEKKLWDIQPLTQEEFDEFFDELAEWTARKLGTKNLRFIFSDKAIGEPFTEHYKGKWGNKVFKPIK